MGAWEVDFLSGESWQSVQQVAQNTHSESPVSLRIVYILSAVLQCPVARVGGGGVEGKCGAAAFPLQVDDDFDPCGSQILKPPAAGRTGTNRFQHLLRQRVTTRPFRHVCVGLQVRRRRRSANTHTHTQTKCTRKTHGANLPTLLRGENTWCTHAKPCDTSRTPTPLLKELQLQHFDTESTPSVSFLFNLGPATSPLYLLHTSIPREAASHCLLSQHALHLTAVVRASDPCTSPWLLVSCCSQDLFLHLHTGPRK